MRSSGSPSAWRMSACSVARSPVGVWIAMAAPVASDTITLTGFIHTFIEVADLEIGVFGRDDIDPVTADDEDAFFIAGLPRGGAFALEVRGTGLVTTLQPVAASDAHIYGLRYMGTLYGIVFFSHQLGSFLGVWLGAWLYDLYGSYNTIWWVGVGTSVFSAVVHIPVRERRAGMQAA